MACDLWGLLLRGLIRDADLGVPRDALGGLIERGDTRGDLRIGIGADFVAVFGVERIDDGAADKAILAGAHGRRGGQSGAVSLSVVHELLHQTDGRRGPGRARVPRVIIAPPQHGQ